MNLRIMPFVRIVSKRCDQLQRLQMTVAVMIRNAQGLNLSPHNVECLECLNSAIDEFLAIALNTASSCLGAGEPFVPSDVTEPDSEILSFPGNGKPAGDTPPEDAG